MTSHLRKNNKQHLRRAHGNITNCIGKLQDVLSTYIPSLDWYLENKGTLPQETIIHIETLQLMIDTSEKLANVLDEFERTV